MKKTLLIILLSTLSITLYAQKEVTQFLGIPVDGSKSAMIRKLKTKGYTINPYNKDVLTGEFNGANVNIHIVTNKNKVWRIMVADNNPMSQEDIKIRFNRLCQQFKDNKKYIPLYPNCSLSPEENISYGMSTLDKKYGAIFYQLSTTVDFIIAKRIHPTLLLEYSTNPTIEKTKDPTTAQILETILNRPVWFTIQEHQGKYCIAIYYDNEYNRANGEDL